LEISGEVSAALSGHGGLSLSPGGLDRGRARLGAQRGAKIGAQ
tara:strand:- start:108 stop:236 length:129 start_codon:yes stop_codon:yes gene_type:complete